jgi:AraC-like DNA-binding protein
MDALSQTLAVVHMTGAIFINARFTAPWCYRSPTASSAARILEPSAEQVVIFHFITEGECFVEMPDGSVSHLRAGDVAIFPSGEAHRMGSQPGLAAAKPARPLEALLARRPRRLSYGGGGTVTRVVCGYMACDERLGRMLLGGLPPLLQVNVRGSSCSAWLESSLEYALHEARSPRPGGSAVLSKLAEILFVEVLRLSIQHSQASRRGWLAGVGDRIVGPALKAMHAAPARAWTLEDLAHHIGSSRSVLAERFLALVDITPMQYLTQWRMLLAANLLRRSQAPLAHIAEQVGYQTDTAFSRAFHREFGMPPAKWRRARMTDPP